MKVSPVQVRISPFAFGFGESTVYILYTGDSISDSTKVRYNKLWWMLWYWLKYYKKKTSNVWQIVHITIITFTFSEKWKRSNITVFIYKLVSSKPLYHIKQWDMFHCATISFYYSKIKCEHFYFYMSKIIQQFRIKRRREELPHFWAFLNHTESWNCIYCPRISIENEEK